MNARLGMLGLALCAGLLSVGNAAITDNANDAYTLVVDVFQSGNSTFYPSLATRLNQTDAVNVNFLVLSAVSPVEPSDAVPGQKPTVSHPEFLPAAGGNLFDLLKNNLPSRFSTPGHWVFVMPDVELLNAWTLWESTLPDADKTGPCSLPAGLTPPQAEILASICWATEMNRQLGTPLIQGVAYDGQGNLLKSTSDNMLWLKNELATYRQADPNVPKYFAWTGDGITDNADVSFIEMYDRIQGAAPHQRLTEVAQEGEYHYIPSSCSPTATQECTSIPGALFPGEQFEALITDPNPNHGGKKIPAGAMGASISDCAAATQGGAEADPACDTYATYVDVSKSMENQILQSYQYIFLLKPKSQSFSDLGSALAAMNISTDNAPPKTVYLFSTQYFGPEQSAIPQKLGQGCVLNEIDKTAACGIENGFGAWQGQTGLQSFKNLTHQFLYAMQASKPGCQADGTGCHFDGYAGIYEYDFIPLSWYSGS